MDPIYAQNNAVETYVPGAFTTWKADAMRAVTSSAADRRVAYIGLATGGLQNNAYVFTDPKVARKTLISGDLADIVEIALRTSGPDGQTPAAVIAVNPQGGTPATFALKDATDKTFATLTTVAVREGANQTQLTLTGDAATGYSLQIVDPISGLRLGHTRLGLALFLQYVGAGSAATAEVTTVSGVKTLTVAVTGAAQDGFTLPVDGLTVSQLVQQINQSGPFNAYVSRDGSLDAAGLDDVTPVNIMAFTPVASLTASAAQGATSLTVSATARAVTNGETLRFRTAGGWLPVTVTASAAQGATTLSVRALGAAVASGSVLFDNVARAPVALSAVKADFALFFERRGEGSVEYAAGAADAAAPIAQAGRFSGGTSIGAGAGDWQAAAEAAFEEDFGAIAVLTDDQGIVGGIAAIVETQRGPEHSRPTQFFRGVDDARIPASESDLDLNAFEADVAAEVASINDRDNVYVAQRVRVLDPATGRVRYVKPYVVAAMLAALRAASGPAVSLTAKALNGSQPYPNLSKRKNAFTRNGVLVLEAPRRGAAAQVVLGRTTYVGENNPVYQSEKQVAIMNAITRDVHAIEQASIPGEATNDAVAAYQRRLDEYGRTRKAQKWVTDGLDERGNAVSAFAFKVGPSSYQGRKISTTIACNPTGEWLVSDTEITARAVEINLG